MVFFTYTAGCILCSDIHLSPFLQILYLPGNLPSLLTGMKPYPAHSDTTVARMLVGNKCDLESIRDVTVEEGKSLAESEGLFFMETSALDATNVKTAFEIVIKEIYNNVSRKVLNSDAYKAELSVNRVTLVGNGTDGSKRSQSYTCCSS